ncbi:MAG: tRNA (adenosine(37)-N6)-threonylcarbamoyltransferase complex dimerization subunit type 1 TsaB [Clostridia bacterium]|nr:tRNA (adenosine(37)-N6)-threonylcarbamoyltransferase complex dimerization subunit type 1 TsaB [Clostridia bacterium]
MNLLTIDTSGQVAGCAVMVDGRVTYQVVMNRGLTHSETIMPAVDQALTASGLTCGDIDVFAAVAGPGSFTGVRIGVCAVKGLAHAVGKPCARVHALEALSMNFYGFDGLCCPILDARRGQVYCAAYDMKNGLPVEAVAPGAVPLADFIGALPADRRLAFVGDGVPAYGDKISKMLGSRALIAPENLRDLRPDAACVLAAARPDRWMEARYLTPIYLRAPQAERERAAGRDHTKPLRRQREEAAK